MIWLLKKYVDSETLTIDGNNSMSGTLNMNNQDIDRVKSIFFGSSGRLNMEGGFIYNLGNPTLAGYAVTKGYVDDQTKNLLRLDGARAMTENLNMGARDHAILGVRSSSADNSVITVGGAKATYLPLNGENVMQGSLKMNQRKL